MLNPHHRSPYRAIISMFVLKFLSNWMYYNPYFIWRNDNNKVKATFLKYVSKQWRKGMNVEKRKEAWWGNEWGLLMLRIKEEYTLFPINWCILRVLNKLSWKAKRNQAQFRNYRMQIHKTSSEEQTNNENVPNELITRDWHF